LHPLRSVLRVRSCPPAQLQADIAERDKQDSERAISPLRQAEDALLLDTSDMGISEVTERILQLVQERAQ
uniref:(d)CMP kinase n=1 Tax=Phascolarctobacterium succinatutens TaxID=626940 RepID=UPI0030803745